MAQENADAHVQLLIEDVSTDGAQLEPPVATVSGLIVRVFRGDSTLLGQRASLQLHYYVPGQTNVRPGSVGVRPLSEIRTGRVVEALVSKRADALQIPLGLCMLLDEPTEQPRYVWHLQSPEAERSRRWLPVAAFALALGAASYLWFMR